MRGFLAPYHQILEQHLRQPSCHGAVRRQVETQAQGDQPHPFPSSFGRLEPASHFVERHPLHLVHRLRFAVIVVKLGEVAGQLLVGPGVRLVAGKLRVPETGDWARRQIESGEEPILAVAFARRVERRLGFGPLLEAALDLIRDPLAKFSLLLREVGGEGLLVFLHVQ